MEMERKDGDGESREEGQWWFHHFNPDTLASWSTDHEVPISKACSIYKQSNVGHVCGSWKLVGI